MGNNCGYTDFASDDLPAVEESACIPPRGSSERCMYQSCSAVSDCSAAQKAEGWVCGVVWLVRRRRQQCTAACQRCC